MGASSGEGYTLFVGVDVAAKTFTASWTDGTLPPTRSLTFDQTSAGYATLHEQLHTSGHEPQATLVVMEATGTYWIT